MKICNLNSLNISQFSKKKKKLKNNDFWRKIAQVIYEDIEKKELNVNTRQLKLTVYPPLR